MATKDCARPIERTRAPCRLNPKYKHRGVRTTGEKCCFQRAQTASTVKRNIKKSNAGYDFETDDWFESIRANRDKKKRKRKKKEIVPAPIPRVASIPRAPSPVPLLQPIIDVAKPMVKAIAQIPETFAAIPETIADAINPPAPALRNEPLPPAPSLHREPLPPPPLPLELSPPAYSPKEPQIRSPPHLPFGSGYEDDKDGPCENRPPCGKERILALDKDGYACCYDTAMTPAEKEIRLAAYKKRLDEQIKELVNDCADDIMELINAFQSDYDYVTKDAQQAGAYLDSLYDNMIAEIRAGVSLASSEAHNKFVSERNRIFANKGMYLPYKWEVLARLHLLFLGDDRTRFALARDDLFADKNINTKWAKLNLWIWNNEQQMEQQ